MEGTSWFLLASSGEMKQGARHRRKNCSKEPELGGSGSSQPLQRAKDPNCGNKLLKACIEKSLIK